MAIPELPASDPLNHQFPARADAVVAAVLFAVTLLLYLPTAGFDFVDFDDDHFIKLNSIVSSGLTRSGFARAWTMALEGNWTPLTTLSWMFDVSVWGLRPGPFHVVNAVLHAANVVLLYCLLKLLTGAGGRSAAVALLFGVHPLHVESVAWISERRDVLFLFWLLVSLLCYRQYVVHSGTLRYALTTIAFLLALLSKSMAVTVPLLMLTLDYWPLQRWQNEIDDATPFSIAKWKQLFREKIPWLAMSLLTGIITIIAQQQAGATALAAQLNWVSRICNAFNALCFYLVKTVWPTQLQVLYEHPRNAWNPWQVAVSAGVVAVISIWVARNGRSQRYLLTGWCWYLISLLPVLGLLQVGEQAYADRYSYLPQVGLGIMIVWQAADWLAPWRHARLIGSLLTAISALALALTTSHQITTWKNGATLWQHVLSNDPHQVMANFKVGEWEMRAGRYLEAEQHYRRAIQLRPSFILPWVFLGSNHEKQGDLPQAAATYREALQHDPRNALALKNLGRVLHELGEVEEAQSVLTRAVDADPTDPDVRNRLGFLYGGRGDVDAATKMFADAVRVAPENALSRINLGMGLIAQGKPDQAREQLQKAVQLEPQNAAAHANLAVALEQLGRIPEAISEYAEALRLNPADVQSRQRLEALRPKN